MHPEANILDDLVRRILAVIQPRRIILFGSAARGDMRPDSDLDILVVVPDGTPSRQTAQIIYQNLIGWRAAVDVVATESDLQHTVITSVWSITPLYVRAGPSMPPDAPLPGSPEDWLRHARSDLALALQRHAPDILLTTLCFHTQQAVEKASRRSWYSSPRGSRYAAARHSTLVSLLVACPPS